MGILKESWKSLVKPSSITLKEGYDDFTKSVIILESFERGFGDTLANSLRRVMLSSIAGFAVTSIKIDGVLHEYSAIDGVVEDVIDIIMNIKNLSITKDTSESFTLKVSSSKEGPLYAGDIDLPPNVSINNQDLVICNLNKNGKISIQMNVECGKGYMPSANDQNGQIGLILIDAIFSPVKKVSYKVENSRVGQVTDYDRIIFEIETNGSITPREALATAAKIIQDQLSAFINFDIEDNDLSSVKKDYEIDMEFNVDLLKTIEELELSVRSYNCLKNENIVYVGDLVTKTESDMLKTANFGKKSLNELKDILRSMGFVFGMKLVNWPPKNFEDLLKIKNKEF
jgi:DNA-directed RNA polymerase subunit alpha